MDPVGPQKGERTQGTNGSTPRFSPESTKTTSISLLTTKPLFEKKKKKFRSFQQPSSLTVVEAGSQRSWSGSGEGPLLGTDCSLLIESSHSGKIKLDLWSLLRKALISFMRAPPS